MASLSDTTTAPRSNPVRRSIEAVLYGLLLLIGWTILFVWFRIRIKNRGLMPKRGPVLVVSNHRSFLDPYVVHAVTNRRMRYLMTHEYYYDMRMRWFYDFIGCIPVGGKHPGEEALDRAARALESGEVVSIFPEGSVATDGSLRPFRRGAAILAFRTGAPVVPVFVAGTHEALPRGAWFPRPRTITVLVGEPIQVPRAPADTLPRDEMDRLTRRLQESVVALGRAALGDVTATRVSPHADGDGQARPQTVGSG
jgi:1-acyl-sn-glycerol-3-phosphate acyltransferase